jgi:hypothetical protein
MEQTFNRPLCAATAIAAVLALGSTPASAQDAIGADAPAAATSSPPPIVLPDTAVPTVPARVAQPQIVLPDVTEPPVAAPNAETEPVEIASQAAAARVRDRARTEPAASQTQTLAEPDERVAPVESVAASTTEGGNIDQAVPEANAPAAERPVANGPANDALSAPTPENEGIPDEAIVGLLALLGIGGAGYALMRSRRRRHAAVTEPATFPPAARVGHAVTQPTFAPEPKVAAAVAGPTSVHTVTTGTVAKPDHADTHRALFEMPSGELPHGTAREALLDRMVAAAPDKANPFTSRKARRRRARLILQHREHLGNQDQSFDWRTYRRTTKSPDPVLPPKVTA